MSKTDVQRVEPESHAVGPDPESPVSDNPHYWYALYTRPRHEKQVREELLQHRIDSYLPTHKVRRRWSDRYKIVEEPLFKNYLFVHVDQRRCRESLKPYGAVSFVTTEGRPAIIPDDEIEAVRIMVTSEIPHNPYPYLKAGRKVRVKYGPLEGCEGILVRKKGIDRLVVTVNLLQRSIEAELDAAWIEPR
jgi:transcription elongation factor/antiterminator RfaH